MTATELEQLPDPPGGRYELYHGELVAMPPPKQGHKLIERALRRMLEAAAGDVGVVETEYGFRPAPEYEYRVADVAVIAMTRWSEVPRNGYLMVDDPIRNQIRVTNSAGMVRYYAPGDQISLYFGGSIRTDSIFE